MQKSIKIKGILKACLLIAIILALVTPGSNMTANITYSEDSKIEVDSVEEPFMNKYSENNFQIERIKQTKGARQQEFTITTLADGSSEKNLTFDEAGDLVEHLSIPKNATVLSANMTLTGYGLEVETENLMFSDDFEDGDISDWTPVFSGSGFVVVEQYPGPDWSLNIYSFQSTGMAYAKSPLSFPLDEFTDYNVSMEFGFESPLHWIEVFRNGHITAILDNFVGGNNWRFICWYDGSAHLITYLSPSTSYDIEYKVHPGLNNYDIYVGGYLQETCDCDSSGPPFPQFRIGDTESGFANYGMAVYDDFIIMQNSSVLIYPLDPTLDVGDDGDLQWSYSGEFDTTETVPDFSDELNEYLATCDSPGENCLVPLVFHSDSAGIINISNILIEYSLPPENNPPEQPNTPSGPTTLYVGEEYTYSTSAVDLDEDQLYYQWNWGNELSEWDGPYDSAETVYANHRWIDQGTFPVKVKAKDTQGAESLWSDVLVVSVSPMSSNWLGNSRITDNDTHESKYPATDIDSLGNIHVAWQDNRDGNWEIYYKKLDNDGNEIVADTRLTNDTAFSESPGVGIDTGDDVVIVFQDNRDDNYEIYYQKLNNDGTPVGGNIRITDDDSADSQYPKVMVSDADNVHVAWQDNRDGNWEVYYKKLDNNGTSLTGDTRISELLGNSLHPALTVYQDTLAHLLWHDYRDDNSEIYYDDAVIDLCPVSIDYRSHDPNHPYLAIVNELGDLYVVIENVGDITVYNARVDILLDETILHTEYVNIAPSETYEIPPIDPSFDPEDEGYHTLSVVIDPEEQLSEHNRENNIIENNIPILKSGDVYDILPISSTQIYVDSLLACSQLLIDSPSAELILDNSTLIFYDHPMYPIEAIVDQNGQLTLLDSTITTSHHSEYIEVFEISTLAQSAEIIGSHLDHLGGPDGLLILCPDVLLSHCSITDSQMSAVAIENLGGSYSFDNLTILNSGAEDFQVYNGIVQVYNSHFDPEKVFVGTGEFNYYKNLQITIWDEHDNRAVNALVNITDAFETLICFEITDENGQIPLQQLQVVTYLPGGTIEYAPFNITSTNQSSGNFSVIGVGFAGGCGLFHSGLGGFDDHIPDYKRTKFALLLAGTTPGRVSFWNDIDYMYHILDDLRGYRPENIQVLFMDGQDGYNNQNDKINYSATRANLVTALQYIGGRIKNDENNRDTLFIYTSNHGGSDNSVCMWDGDNIKDTELAEMIEDNIDDNASRIFIVMNQCYSDAFIDDLNGDNRVIVVATKFDNTETVRYGCTRNGHSMGHCYFSVEFSSALHNHDDDRSIGYYPDDDLDYSPTDCKKYPDGQQITRHIDPIDEDLDDDNNGIISFHEAFDFAREHDLIGPYGHYATEDDPQEIDDDIVAFGGQGGYINISYYDGDGTLSGTYINAGGSGTDIRKIVVANMDRKSKDDIVFIDYLSKKLHVWINNGDWTFTSDSYNIGGQPQALLVEDINLDAHPDVIVLSKQEDKVEIFLNKADNTGDLETRVDYPVGDEPVDFYIANFNNDIFKDLVVVNSKDENFSLLLNDGSGGFENRINYRLTGEPLCLTIGDIDNDDDNDLVVPYKYTQNNHKIEILINEEERWPERVITDEALLAWSVFAIDMDNDDDIDIISASPEDDTITWYENNGRSPPSWTEYVISDSADFVWHIYAEDIDKDDDIDVIAASSDDNRIIFCENDGNPHHDYWTIWNIASDAEYSEAVFAADIDNDIDHTIDVVASSYDKLAWYKNDGSPQQHDWEENIISNHPDDIVSSVYAADIDDDNDVDVVGCYWWGDRVSWYENKGGNPPQWREWNISIQQDSTPISVYVADIDNDTYVDVVCGFHGSNDLVWFDNNGNPHQHDWPKRNITTIGNIRRVFATDMDHDNDIDVLGAFGVSDNSLVWFENDGTTFPSWTQHNVTTSFPSAEGCFAADIDNDDDIDVIGTAAGADKVSWFENGKFTALTWNLDAGRDPIKTAILDFDENDFPDIFVLNKQSYSGYGSLRVYINQGDTTFQIRDPTPLYFCYNPTDLFFSDLDGDEDIDMVIPATGKLATVLNYFNENKDSDFGITANDADYSPYCVHGTNHNRPRRWYL